jgi:signal transduction histidine kinase
MTRIGGSLRRGASKPLGWFGWIVGLWLGLTSVALSLEAQEPPADPGRVLTNIYQIWELPPAEKERLYRIQTEVVVYYFDAEWGNAWGECLGMPCYLPLSDCPTRLKAGQRVGLDGWVSPGRERFIWEKTRVRVLEEGLKLKGEPVQNLAEGAAGLQKHWVTVEGLIDGLREDSTHLTLSFLGEGAVATAFVQKGTERASPWFKAGDYVRIQGVYHSQYDREGKVADLTLWVPSLDDVEVIGSLANDKRFDLPIRGIEQLDEGTPTNQMVRVRGKVRAHEPGKWVTLWDGTGQVMVQSRQASPLRFGDWVEAVGYPYALGVQQCLHGGLYRLLEATNRLGMESDSGLSPRLLRLAEQVRELSREEASQHPAVMLRAMVTWIHRETAFAYVQDASGGIRLANPKWDSPEAARAGAIVLVRGEGAEGDYVPVVTNASVTRAGYWDLDVAQRVSLEEALTGVQEGRWIEMRGFVRQVRPMNGLVAMNLSSSGGEFEVWTPASQSYDYLKGAFIHAQGVCSATANSRRQLTGIRVLSPEAKFLQIEEAAPEDVFAAPFRPLGALRRFDFQNALDRRVRISGTVVMQAPGRYLYLQEGADGVFALCRQPELVLPGDRVEAVGFPGNDRGKFIMREAVFRRIGTGPEPTPLKLSPGKAVDADWEGLLVRAEGVLLNAVAKDGKQQMLVRTGDSTFEATLDAAAGLSQSQMADLEVGSRLALTGVYDLQMDEYGKPRSFLLRLRSSRDVRVLSRPPWWTLARLMWVLLGLVVVALLAMVWGLLIARKNKLLRQAQGQLQAANDELEMRVEARTRELREEVAAKESARAELAKAQEDLMLASRQAGMAEVATSVLHNVGNVLNSVNVSASLLGQHVRQSKVEYVAKAAALLRQPPEELARFLATDPKGKALPGYLEELGKALVQERSFLEEELRLLAGNIDHIKAIVAMQQSHAKAGGVTERLQPKDLVEHAMQIHSAAFARCGIEICRDYQPAPAVLADRHKVLQILVNLVSNAEHALRDTSGEKRVRLAVSPQGVGRVIISVQDNGSGIAPENLDRIFSQGFTTRNDGHGFGLHSGANAAKELGGSLSVQSDGPGKGATFTLVLPVA